MSGDIKVFPFTTKYPGLYNVLANNIKIKEDFDPSTPQANKQDYLAIWDTGATNSVITSKVVNDLSLIPTGMTKVQGVTGVEVVNTYLVCFYLPNLLYLNNLTVTESSSLTGCDALIGMDVIGRGDFAVTNFNGKTVFTFRMPSCEKIDFILDKKEQESKLMGKVYRKNPCPCGSGMRYQQCHGKY